ncbi:hypothetical protein PYCC9005_004988 [Savitreella phatthalungensis]
MTSQFHGTAQYEELCATFDPRETVTEYALRRMKELGLNTEPVDLDDLVSHAQAQPLLIRQRNGQIVLSVWMPRPEGEGTWINRVRREISRDTPEGRFFKWMKSDLFHHEAWKKVPLSDSSYGFSEAAVKVAWCLRQIHKHQIEDHKMEMRYLKVLIEHALAGSCARYDCPRDWLNHEIYLLIGWAPERSDDQDPSPPKGSRWTSNVCGHSIRPYVGRTQSNPKRAYKHFGSRFAKQDIDQTLEKIHQAEEELFGGSRSGNDVKHISLVIHWRTAPGDVKDLESNMITAARTHFLELGCNHGGNETSHWICLPSFNGEQSGKQRWKTAHRQVMDWLDSYRPSRLMLVKEGPLAGFMVPSANRAHGMGTKVDPGFRKTFHNMDLAVRNGCRACRLDYNTLDVATAEQLLRNVDPRASRGPHRNRYMRM